MIEQWHDFFVMVGGGAAALTGLVFVAMSINLDAITKDSTHRYRAVGTLTGFTAGFIMCALALMGDQSLPFLGAEWLIISLISSFIYINGYVQARKKGGSWVGMPYYRLIAGTGLYILEILGTIMMVLNYQMGLYIVTATLVMLVAYTITGAWLLLVGVNQETKRK